MYRCRKRYENERQRERAKGQIKKERMIKTYVTSLSKYIQQKKESKNQSDIDY